MNIAQLVQRKDSAQFNSFYVSFADLMVLLATFFVLIIAMSKIEIGSFEKFKTSFTGEKSNTLVELAERLSVISKKQKGVHVSLAKDGVRIDIDSAALFESASAILNYKFLAPINPLLNEVLNSKYNIDIEGHTDDVAYYRRRGDEIASNWSLSGSRASSMAHYLIEMGFDEKRIRIVGYASNRPIKHVENIQGDLLEKYRALNRRVSLLVR